MRHASFHAGHVRQNQSIARPAKPSLIGTSTWRDAAARGERERRAHGVVGRSVQRVHAVARHAAPRLDALPRRRRVLRAGHRGYLVHAAGARPRLSRLLRRRRVGGVGGRRRHAVLLQQRDGRDDVGAAGRAAARAPRAELRRLLASARDANESFTLAYVKLGAADELAAAGGDGELQKE